MTACSAATPPKPATKSSPPARRDLAVQRDGFTLHVTVVGDLGTEPPLVALPGGPGLSADYLRPLEALATATRAVVLVDPRGTGKSTAPSGDGWTLDDYNADLQAVLEQLEVPRAHLLGHSYSGLYVMAYTGAHPERVASLVMIDVIPPTAPELRTAFGGFIARLGELQKQGIVPAELPSDDDCTAQMRALAPVWYANPKHPTASQLGGATCTNVRPRSKPLASYDVSRTAQAYAGRALLVVPEQSPFGDMGTLIAPALPRAKTELKRIPACGHMPLDECPQPTLEAITAFLATK